MSALTAFLIVVGCLHADDPYSIISEWNASIQLISTTDFNAWPGVSGIAPVDVSTAAGRIWLIWPGSIINLNEKGRTDEQTLLTLFATRTAPWGNESWTARNGVVCSDAYWRGFTDLQSEFAQLNLLSGEVSMRPWGGDIPDSIYPSSNGKILIFTGMDTVLAGFDTREIHIDSDIPPVSLLTVSGTEPLAAWRDGESNGIHIAGYGNDVSAYHRIINLEKDLLPAAAPWSMGWAGKLLVLAYPGKLFALDIPDEGDPLIYQLTDLRLPDRWYRIRGDENRLVVQSPEAGILALITVRAAEDDVQNSIRQDDGEFADLLRVNTLSAGDNLEKSGYFRQAERYYGWVLPYIREYRSRYPLEEIWPELESEITRRRMTLR